MGARREERGQSTATIHMTKKCPECFAYLPLPATVCTSCGKRVGPVDKLGHARRPPNVMGYLAAAISILAFVAFVYWGFFMD